MARATAAWPKGPWPASATPRTRLVTHLDVDASGIDRAVEAFASSRRG